MTQTSPPLPHSRQTKNMGGWYMREISIYKISVDWNKTGIRFRGHVTGNFHQPTSDLCHLTSDFCPLSSDLRPPTSVIRPPTSDLCHPTSDL